MGQEFFEDNIKIKGEKISGPQKMAYLFDDLSNIFDNSEVCNYLNKILKKIPKSQISSKKMLDVFRLAQGCVSTNKVDLLKNITEREGDIKYNEFIEEIGKELLKIFIKNMEISEEINLDKLNKWLTLEDPWGAVIAFSTFYQKYKDNDYETEAKL